MKKELSSLEIKYIADELQSLINSRVDTVYHPEKTEILIQFYVRSIGKRVLRILPKFIYLTEEKRSVDSPSGFCMLLRKCLNNSRLTELTQINAERVIKLTFETKEKSFNLYIEMFGKGNIILTKKDNAILGLLDRHIWKDRDLRVKEIYKLPPEKLNYFKLNNEELKKALDSQKTLVKKLATDIGVGGIFAEEICLITGIDKTKKSVDETEENKLLKAIKSLTNTKRSPNVVYKDNKIIDIVPFKLKLYKDNKIKEFKEYNAALNQCLSDVLNASLENEKTKTHTKNIEKIEAVILAQNKKIKEIKSSITETEKKAELIYTNYKQVSEILDTINKAKQKYSWKEIKDKLKGHIVIKEINSKDKKVILELK